MPNPVHLIRRYPMLSFAALACLFGWSPYIASALGHFEHPENTPLGPVLAALVVLLCQGRSSLGAWWKRIRSVRTAPGWHALALLAPALAHVVGVLVNHGLGAPLPTGEQLSHWPQVPITFVVMLVLVGIGEEAAWTAFAAPVLLRRHGLLGAWAIMSALRIFWHLPLMIGGQMPWAVGIVANAGFQMIVLVMLSASGGRWSLAAVWHASLNALGFSWFFGMVSGPDLERLSTIQWVAYGVMGIAALVLSRRLRSTGDAAETVIHEATPAPLVTDRTRYGSRGERPTTPSAATRRATA
jgi:membrane protease YdiL (CAAX protease family)